MRIAPVVLLVTATTTAARGDGHLGAHLGGGLEGGLISGKPRPDAVGELGLAADWIPDDHDVGVGVVLDRIARPLDIAGEHTLDLELRIRGKHASRIGFGMGIRWLDPGGDQPQWFGYDWMRMDTTIPIARGAHGSVDFYFHWTFGCYVSHGDAMPERPQVASRDVHCGDTITSSYVLGLQIGAN